MSPYSLKTRNLFESDSKKPFKLSRSKIDLFKQCKRCFYLDRRFGLSRPDGPPFTLNVAVDHLLKKEFDVHRREETAHPLMEKYGVDAIPFSHPDIDIWRENFVGVQYTHEETNMVITGAVDDVWVNPKGELIVVDYKATAKDGEITLEDTPWHNQYRRQMEVYQWLLKQKGFPVSNTGYFVYVNGKKDRASFDGKLEFDVKIISYTGDDSWISDTLSNIKKVLDDDRIPSADEGCDYCGYIDAYLKVLKGSAQKQKKEKDSGTLF